jgi:hypothetical protein
MFRTAGGSDRVIPRDYPVATARGSERLQPIALNTSERRILRLDMEKSYE